MTVKPTAPDPPVATSPKSPEYLDDGRAIYWLKYYVVFFTRRRKPFFADAAVKARAEELLLETAEELGCKVTRLDVYPSTVELHVEAPPTLSPHVLSSRLRKGAAGPLKAEFEELRRATAVFVKRYVVSTVPVPEADGEAVKERIPSRS